MICQGWQTLRVALEDIGGLLRDLVPWPRRRRVPDPQGPGNRPVGTCSKCGQTVHYSPVARLACCAKGCTVITRAELEDGALKC